MNATQPIPQQISDRLKAAAATPVKNGNTMPRQIAIDKAIAWCKQTFPNHFHGENYEPPKSTRSAFRRGPSQSKTDRPGD